MRKVYITTSIFLWGANIKLWIYIDKKPVMPSIKSICLYSKKKNDKLQLKLKHSNSLFQTPPHTFKYQNQKPNFSLNANFKLQI